MRKRKGGIVADGARGGRRWNTQGKSWCLIAAVAASSRHGRTEHWYRRRRHCRRWLCCVAVRPCAPFRFDGKANNRLRSCALQQTRLALRRVTRDDRSVSSHTFNALLEGSRVHTPQGLWSREEWIRAEADMLHYDSVAKAGNCVLLSPLTVLEERSAVRFAITVLD